MPDITMCTGEGVPHCLDKKLHRTSVVCPKRDACFLFKATPSEFRQTYFLGIPYDPVTNECKHFINVPEENDVPKITFNTKISDV